MKSLILYCSLIGLCLLGSTLLAQTVAPRAESQKQTGSPTQVVLLGTGTPNAEPERSGPSLAIVVDDNAYIVDFGPGVVRRATAAFRKGIKALEAKKLTRAFLTHLHSDHTAGYPDLIFTPWVLERQQPLEVYGPPGLTAMTKNILKAFQEDIRIRTTGGEPSRKTNPIVIAHEIKPGIVYQDKLVKVTAFHVNHGSWREAFGYKFETPDRTIVISGDTGLSQNVIDSCNGCDLLIHEVYSLAGFASRPPAWQKYHSTFHTSSKELAELANKARPKLLVLYHQLIWNSTEEELLNEIRQIYKGEVVSGHDLDLY